MLPVADLDSDVLQTAVVGKLLGSARATRRSSAADPPPASVTLTSGAYGTTTPQMAAGALVNAGLEQFVRHAATEIGTGTSVNVVRPGWVQETLDALELDRSGTPASMIAQTYLTAIEGTAHGEILVPSI